MTYSCHRELLALLEMGIIAFPYIPVWTARSRSPCRDAQLLYERSKDLSRIDDRARAYDFSVTALLIDPSTSSQPADEPILWVWDQQASVREVDGNVSSHALLGPTKAEAYLQQRLNLPSTYLATLTLASNIYDETSHAHPSPSYNFGTSISYCLLDVKPAKKHIDFGSSRKSMWATYTREGEYVPPWIPTAEEYKPSIK
ncbi:hypothetical protein V8F33_003033 [Rhypophila sp. PSN 637]